MQTFIRATFTGKKRPETGVDMFVAAGIDRFATPEHIIGGVMLL